MSASSSVYAYDTRLCTPGPLERRLFSDGLNVWRILVTLAEAEAHSTSDVNHWTERADVAVWAAAETMESPAVHQYALPIRRCGFVLFCCERARVSVRTKVVTAWFLETTSAMWKACAYRGHLYGINDCVFISLSVTKRWRFRSSWACPVG